MASVPNFEDILRFSLCSKIVLARVNVRREATYQFLKPKQSKCLKSALDGDTMAVLPTGYGKSLVYAHDI